MTSINRINQLINKEQASPPPPPVSNAVGTSHKGASRETPMDTTPPLNRSVKSHGGASNQGMSNSQLARGLSMPSPNRNSSSEMIISPPQPPQSKQQSNKYPNTVSTNKSLTSIPSIIENSNLNRNSSNQLISSLSNTSISSRKFC